MFRALFVRRFHEVAPFGGLRIQGKHRAATAPFLGLAMTPLVGEKVIHCGEQERPEFASVPMHPLKPVAFQQPAEEFLREILRVSRFVAAPPHIGVEGIPVSAAELIQGARGRPLRAIPGL